ncbi:unnamed protein product [Rhizoctonia solani]|uniref:Uncharacterized protein n=1 Tax=Rhizoctonia solani TaxID=456999 RepID=A0A8H3C614_9AGAM|nr:unnamed protein product [Rhizoctonia solani]CAE6474924.1 unnamed protein product [Rhizoctonia solani]
MSHSALVSRKFMDGLLYKVPKVAVLKTIGIPLSTMAATWKTTVEPTKATSCKKGGKTIAFPPNKSDTAIPVDATTVSASQNQIVEWDNAL